jgi:hypothetical protein
MDRASQVAAVGAVGQAELARDGQLLAAGLEVRVLDEAPFAGPVGPAWQVLGGITEQLPDPGRALVGVLGQQLEQRVALQPVIVRERSQRVADAGIELRRVEGRPHVSLARKLAYEDPRATSKCAGGPLGAQVEASHRVPSSVHLEVQLGEPL